MLAKHAVVAHVQAVLPSWDAAWAVCPAEALFVQVILPALIGNAQGAVHPARSDEIFIHFRTSMLQGFS